MIITPSGSNIRNNPRPVIAGSAEPGTTITVYADDIAIGTTTTNANGNWSITSTINLGEGAHTFRAQATDPDGNVSANSNTTTIIIDTVVPTVSMASGSPLWDATPLITGTAENGATITLTVNGAIYKAVATGGAWSIDLGTATPVSGTLALNLHGQNSISVIAEDGAGNKSALVSQRLDIEINQLLIGDSRRNLLAGDLGDDTILGAGASDPLYGADGKDSIDGGSGNDVIYGGPATTAPPAEAAATSFTVRPVPTDSMAKRGVTCSAADWPTTRYPAEQVRTSSCSTGNSARGRPTGR